MSTPPIMQDTAAIEQRRLAEQERIDALKSSRRRNRSGQFATPPPLAREMAKVARESWGERCGPIRFLEPALGTGAFYSALLQAFPNTAIDEALGIEVDPLFATAAASLWEDSGLTITRADFTAVRPPDPERRSNLVIANPPYVRHHHLGRDDKERLQALVAERLQISINGLAGLYCYFLLLCDAWLADRGLALWLIPSEFMDVNYGSAVRAYLTEEVTLHRIHRFSPADTQFGDALVTSAVVVFEKTPPPVARTVLMTLGGPLSAPAIEESVPLDLLRRARKWMRYPAGADRAGLVPPGVVTLGDLFTIKRGVATGANGFFILPRDEALERGVPRAFLKPILPSPSHLREAIVEPDEEGYPRLGRPLALIDCDLPEPMVRERFPAFWSYLESGMGREIHRGYLASRRSPWYAQEQRPPAPFLCTYMGRRRDDGRPFRFLWNTTRATAANVYLLLYPKDALKRALGARPALSSAVFSALQGIRADELIVEGRVYGGGLHKMEPKERACLSAEPIVHLLGDMPQARQMDFRF